MRLKVLMNKRTIGLAHENREYLLGRGLTWERSKRDLCSRRMQGGPPARFHKEIKFLNNRHLHSYSAMNSTLAPRGCASLGSKR